MSSLAWELSRLARRGVCRDVVRRLGTVVEIRGDP
jgi:hypothetical protein